jgi:putative ABC transport system permease protein
MVFILTNNRVLERVKEIGILRAMGARKKDISYLFNIENMIIGIISSIIGVVVLFMLEVPIDNLLGLLLDGDGVFKLYNDLIIFSVIFNIFIVVLSGYIPTKMASKKKIVDCFR